MSTVFDALGNPIADFTDKKAPKPNAAPQRFGTKPNGSPTKAVQPKWTGKIGSAKKDKAGVKVEDKIGPIKKGALHKQMGVPAGKKMPRGRMASMASKLHKKVASGKKLSASQLRTSRRLAFAKAARSWHH